jgi:hypothetical protein
MHEPQSLSHPPVVEVILLKNVNGGLLRVEAVAHKIV